MNQIFVYMWWILCIMCGLLSLISSVLRNDWVWMGIALVLTGAFVYKLVQAVREDE